MWECLYCHHEVADNFDECSNCGTGKNWKPSPDVQSFNQEVTETQAATSDAPAFDAGTFSSATTLLRFVGFAMALIGVVAGGVILMDAPAERPTPLYGAVSGDSPFRMVYLVIGWAYIVGGLTTGLLFYVVAGIGDAVRDVWRAAQDKPQ